MRNCCGSLCNDNKTNKALYHTFVTTYGVNPHVGIVQSKVTMGYILKNVNFVPHFILKSVILHRYFILKSVFNPCCSVSSVMK